MHVGVVVQPAHGHVRPMLPLIPELLRRGHRVTYATGPECVQMVADAGARPMEIPAHVPPMYWPDGASEGRVDEMLTTLATGVDDSLPLLIDEFSQDPPDVLCYDLSTEVGRMLAGLLDVPSAAIIPHFAFNESFSMRDAIAIEEGFESAEPPPSWQRYYQRMTEIARRHGTTWRDDALEGTSVADLNLVLIPREFQHEESSFDERFQFIGPLADDSLAIGEWAPRDPEKPLVFISFGTLFNNNPDFYRTCFDAFAGDDWQVAMAAHNLDVDELGPVPENFEVRPYFPQSKVMSRADVVVSHTGIKTLMDAVTHGVKMMIVPPVPMCRMIAERAEAVSLARTLDIETLDADLLRQATEALSVDAEVDRAIAHYQRAISESGGAPRGVEVLEAYVR